MAIVSIDLLVKDIYQGMDTPIDGHLTASNFGKVGITKSIKHPAEDIIATVQGLVGEVITTLSIQYAEEKRLSILSILDQPSAIMLILPV